MQGITKKGLSKLIDLSGRKYNNLTVGAFSHRERQNFYWKCICDCGNFVLVTGASLRTGNTKSCGCLRHAIWNNSRTHGMRNHRIYHVWMTMKERCINPKSSSYKNYGAKGITVCDEWLIFENFLRDMGLPPAGASIERKNNDLGYFKENCRWASIIEQARNKHCVRQVSAHGIIMTIPEWAALSGVKYATLYRRIVIAGQEPMAAIPPYKSDGSVWSKQDEDESRRSAMGHWDHEEV